MHSPRFKAALCAALLLLLTSAGRAQQDDEPQPDAPVAEADDPVAEADDPVQQPADAGAAAASSPASATEELSWGRLILTQGGIFMIPIAGISVLVFAFAVERALALRRAKVAPEGFMQELVEESRRAGGMRVDTAEAICLNTPCTASQVVLSALHKVGGSTADIEAVVQKASEREASRLYSNVRHISLGISVAPLLGLLGTVQGMIIAFFTNVHLPVGANRAASLSEGIYTALVTTLAGLCVAIPAALLAHYFEGRIQGFFRDIEDGMQSIIPALARYEGNPPTRKADTRRAAEVAST